MPDKFLGSRQFLLSLAIGGNGLLELQGGNGAQNGLYLPNPQSRFCHCAQSLSRIGLGFVVPQTDQYLARLNTITFANQNLFNSAGRLAGNFRSCVIGHPPGGNDSLNQGPLHDLDCFDRLTPADDPDGNKNDNNGTQ